jgi:hypothetical protein
MQARNCLADPDRLSTEMNIIRMGVRVRHGWVTPSSSKPAAGNARRWNTVQTARPSSNSQNIDALDCARGQHECHGVTTEKKPHRDPDPCLHRSRFECRLID